MLYSDDDTRYAIKLLIRHVQLNICNESILKSYVQF